MKNKTAVLVFGEFREFENAHKSWNFLKKIDYDLYISTWDVSHEINSLLNIDLHETITEEKILKYFPNATIDIRSGNQFQTPSNKNNFQWRKLFNMTTISGKKYDYVILIRTDIILEERKDFLNFYNNIKDDRIYGLSEIMSKPAPVYLFVQDCFFVGKYELMREVFLTFLPPDISYKDVHYHLSKHFILNDIYVESLHVTYLEYFIMRSIHRKFLNEDFETQKKISVEWWEAKNFNATPNEIIRLLKEKT